MKNIVKPCNVNLFDGAIQTNETCITKWYWPPNDIINKMIEKYCKQLNHTQIDEKILEIGPGCVPFSLATNFIGCNESVQNYIDIDIDKDIFPYKDNEFNFVYCRHVLEDIQNPDFALSEILRTCENGYIETPSPLIEITKNVDALELSKIYSGYIHHRYIVWCSIEKNEIYFLPKYSCVLDNILKIDEKNTNMIYTIINNYPVYWNNYFIFNKKIPPKIIMYKNGINFNNGSGNGFLHEYIALVNMAVNESIQNTNYFINKHSL